MWMLAVASFIMQAMAQANQASAQKKAAQQQEQAAAEARDIAGRNAAADEAATQETARKQGKIDQQAESAARAAAAASGFAYDPNEDNPGSIALSLAAQKKENVTRAEYASSAGKSRADILRRGGQLSYQTGMSQAATTKNAATGSLFGAAGSLLKAGQTTYNWWDTQSKAPSTNTFQAGDSWF